MILVVFLVAVGLDSTGNPAEAADLATHSALVPVQVAVEFRGRVDRVPSDSLASVPLAQGSLAADPLATAQRLRHGRLISPILTSNRLTEAHFFTDLPTVP
jgi:hypothetical protein